MPALDLPLACADIVKLGRMTGRHGLNWFMESAKEVRDTFVPHSTIEDSTVTGFKIRDICIAEVVENNFGSCN
jgi:hypothetical protein